MHQLMLGPRMHVKQLVFLNEFSGDLPAGGSPVRFAQHGGRVWNTSAPIHAGGQSASETVRFFSTSFRVSRPLVGHLCAARSAVEVYGIRMHQLMFGLRMDVKQLFFLNEFSGDPPSGGSPVRCAQRSGSVWNTNAPTYVGAQNAIEKKCFPQRVSGDPPGGGSPVRCA